MNFDGKDEKERIESHVFDRRPILRKKRKKHLK